MLSYRLKCQKNTENKNPKAVRTKNRRIMLLSKCVVSDSKQSELIKQQEASEWLCSLGIRISLNNIPLLGPVLF